LNSFFPKNSTTIFFFLLTIGLSAQGNFETVYETMQDGVYTPTELDQKPTPLVEESEFWKTTYSGMSELQL